VRFHGTNRALLALLLIVPAPSFGAMMMFWVAPGTVGSIAYAIGKLWLYGLPLAWLVVNRQRLRPSAPPKAGVGAGVLSGIVMGGLVLLIYQLYAIHRIDTTQLRDLLTANGLGQPLRYVLACCYLAGINALLEEYAFRWFIFEQCRVLTRGAVAAIASALIFTAHHVLVLTAYFDWDIALLASTGVFAAGVIWSALYLRYQSIWPGYVSHVLVDCAIFIVGWRLLFE